VKTLATQKRAEALRRLPVVVAEIRTKIEAARRTGDGRLKATPPSGALAAQRELDAARWWRERIIAVGGNPNVEQVPDELRTEWYDELDRRYGEPIGEDTDEAGNTERLYDPIREERGNRFRALVRGAVPVTAELERYLTERDVQGSYRSRTRLAVKRLSEWLAKRVGGDNINGVSIRTAALWIDEQGQRGISVQTVNSHASALAVYWRWMVQRGIADASPWDNQQRTARDTGKNAKKRSFTDDEVTTLLSGDTSRTLHDLMRLAALSGMRQNEIASLRIGDIEGDCFVVREAKTRAGVRRVPIHSALKDLMIRRQADKQPHDFLLEELTAPPSRAKRRGAKVGERFTAYRRAVGVDDRLEGRRQASADFHSFRRWFATNMERGGILPHIMSAVVGHSEGRASLTLKSYSTPSDGQLRAAVEAVILPKGAPLVSP
jgi:integrase